MKHAKQARTKGSKKGVNKQSESSGDAFDQSAWCYDIRKNLNAVRHWLDEATEAQTAAQTMRAAKHIGESAAKLNLGFVVIEEGTLKNTDIKVPRIVLEGHWLSNIGFHIGESARVTVRENGTVELKVLTRP